MDQSMHVAAAIMVILCIVGTHDEGKGWKVVKRWLCQSLVCGCNDVVMVFV